MSQDVANGAHDMQQCGVGSLTLARRFCRTVDHLEADMLAGSPLHARQPVSRLGRTTRVPHPAPPVPAPTYAHTLCTLHPAPSTPLTSLPLRLCCIRPGARHAAVVKHQRLQRQLQQQQQRLATVEAQADEAEQQHHSLQSQVQDVHTKRLRGKTTINAAPPQPHSDCPQPSETLPSS